ncbi:hypothetical protein Pogu_0530 [Pyrobaculum oguniense TE7]|uniref:Uncharacterized protein n=1 Tax=Pyrobaculum oguniense (strain DSM 13380 / JCM 10595 / TE7) TaxID=698757 RepID=H6Q793_PYROT|nr:hypothetical protein Pogu_0530 [Pyrobaculum oguniense TE7]
MGGLIWGAVLWLVEELRAAAALLCKEETVFIYRHMCARCCDTSRQLGAEVLFTRRGGAGDDAGCADEGAPRLWTIGVGLCGGG